MSMEATEELLLAAVAQRFPDLTPAELSAALQEATGGADWNANANSRHMKSETGWRPKPSSLSRRRPLVSPGERRATEWGHLAEVREEAAESARLIDPAGSLRTNPRWSRIRRDERTRSRRSQLSVQNCHRRLSDGSRPFWRA